MNIKPFGMDTNAMVKVKLRDIGIKALRENHEKTDSVLRARGHDGLGEFILKTDEEGYTEFIFYQLMAKLGHLLHPSIGDIPFETDFIVLTGKEID